MFIWLVIQNLIPSQVSQININKNEILKHSK